MSVSIMILNGDVLNRVRDDFSDMTDDMFSRGGLRKLMEEIRDEVVIPTIDKNFEVGGRPRWEPLSPATTGMSKEAFIESAATGNIGGRKPLNKSGQMHRAATAKARFHISNNEMRYGDWPEKRWFGPVHDLEALSRKAEIPNRPFAILQPEDQEAITEITFNWIFDNIDKHIKRRYI